MPQDVKCPKCSHTFPVTEARNAFTVACPRCEAVLTAEFKKPAAPPEAGQPPYEVHVKPGVAGDAAAAVPKARKRADDEEVERGGGSAVVVLLSGGLGLLFVLGVLALTGWFLFTQVDVDDNTASRPNTNNNNGNRPAPPPNNIPGGNNSGNQGSNKGGIPGNPGGTKGGNLGGNPGNPIGDNPGGLPPAVDPPKPPKDFFDLKPVKGTLTAITPPADLDEGVSKKIQLGRVDSVAVGGGGRYLVFHSGEGRIQVFDANAADVVKDITMAEAGAVLMAGGANTLAVTLPGARAAKVRVYSLPELQQQNEFDLPLGNAKSIAMGAATNGPLLAADSFGEVALLDLASGRPVEGASGRLGIAGEHVRASHDGRLFLAGRAYRFEDKFSTLTEDQRKWQVKNTEVASAYLGADGRRVYGKNQIVTSVGDVIASKPEGPGNVWYVPAVTANGDYFLRVHDFRPAPGRSKGISVGVHKDKDVNTPVLPAWEGLTETERFVTGITVHVEALDRHLFLIPEAKLLVILNYDKAQIVVRKLPL